MNFVTQPEAIRKKQFRWSVAKDTILLEAILVDNPNLAGFGEIAERWNSIASRIMEMHGGSTEFGSAKLTGVNAKSRFGVLLKLMNDGDLHPTGTNEDTQADSVLSPDNQSQDRDSNADSSESIY